MGVGGHMVETVREMKAWDTSFEAQYSPVNSSDPHKVAPGTNFNAMKYHPEMMFPTHFTVAFL